jgi:large subunit ribosomal protein L1
MATSRPVLAQLSKLCLSHPSPAPRGLGPRFLSTTAACASRGKFAPKILSKEKATISSKGQNPQKNKKKDDGGRKKRKARTTFKTYDSKDAEMFSLCDAMRFVSFPSLHPGNWYWVKDRG